MAGRPPFDGFNPESEDIEGYLERLLEHFIACCILRATRKLLQNEERFS